ncbi:MAG: spore coat protein [Ruminococcaceae bacterium]|nr:spore coat protein [Oscillospiraceae bacterium]
MPNLTAKELTAIEDQLSLEQLLVKKYRMYSRACTDPQIKTKCEQIAARHQTHYDKLLAHLN